MRGVTKLDESRQEEGREVWCGLEDYDTHQSYMIAGPSSCLVGRVHDF
jgi:hypothetical protein